MRKIAQNLTLEKEVRSKGRGSAVIRNHKGGRVHFGWGFSKDMNDKQLVMIEIEGKEAYVSVQDITAALRGV